MATIKSSEAKIFKYEFDVAIDKPIGAAWALLVEKTDKWWMADFRALGEGSTVSLNVEQGGALIERGASGETLEWYRLQMCNPGQSLYLVGYMAPDWGGPTISMLKLSLQPKGGTCILTVSDALLGNISEGKAQNTKEGWKRLFGAGFKNYAEA